MSYEQEIANAARACDSADRMAAGLPCIPDPRTGDLGTVAQLRRELAAAQLLLELHRRFHAMAWCAGLPWCYVCQAEAGVWSEFAVLKIPPVVPGRLVNPTDADNDVGESPMKNPPSR